MKLTKHHIRNRSRGGNSKPKNILMLTEEKHACWHILFGNLTLREAAAVLIRTAEIKERREKK